MDWRGRLPYPAVPSGAFRVNAPAAYPRPLIHGALGTNGIFVRPRFPPSDAELFARSQFAGIPPPRCPVGQPDRFARPPALPFPASQRHPLATLLPQRGAPFFDPYLAQRLPALAPSQLPSFVGPTGPMPSVGFPHWTMPVMMPHGDRARPMPLGGPRDAGFVQPSAADPRLHRDSVDDRQKAAQGERSASGAVRREPVPRVHSSAGGGNASRAEASGQLNRTKVKTDEQSPRQACKPPVADVQSTTSLPADFVRSSPADLYFVKEKSTGNVTSTKRQRELEESFKAELVQRAEKVRSTKPQQHVPAQRSRQLRFHKGCCSHACGGDSGNHSSCSSSDTDSSDDKSTDDNDEAAVDSASPLKEELKRKREHPERLHSELWFNEPGEANDGPLCRCSRKHRSSGIRHGIYPGERPVPLCIPDSNNLDRLHHYKVVISPAVNFTLKQSTQIAYDGRHYVFEGFSVFTHEPLVSMPDAKVVRFNIEYAISLVAEPPPENFSVQSLDLFADYLLNEILELVDLDWWGHSAECRAGCRQFHVMPRFVRALPENGREILSMNEVLRYFIGASQPLVEGPDLARLLSMSDAEWRKYVDDVQGAIVTAPGWRPSSIRVDQLDRAQVPPADGAAAVATVAPGAAASTNGVDVITYPLVVHFGLRPDEVCYAGDPAYQKMWKEYVKLKHLLANKTKVSTEDRHALLAKENRLTQLRSQSSMRRDVTVVLSSESFVRTGFRVDVCQHALMLPVIVAHARFHRSLAHLEKAVGYTFRDRQLLQLCLTHPSHTRCFGTNPDHVRNSLANCGVRRPEYGDRRPLAARNRKRGISTLMNIMAQMGRSGESDVTNNERLEFLGDAVLELVSSVHLYYLFPKLEEGGLATYRAALVQNQQLSVLADRLRLQDFMLYAHGPDLCHDLDLRHAMANCFEALIAALYLDGGLLVADSLFGHVTFGLSDASEKELMHKIWQNLPLHPLQEDMPEGDAALIPSSPVLGKMAEFQERLGCRFDHIRLLARAMTHRNCGFNLLTLGHNQRLEFLGDTVLQLIVSDYLYKNYPAHHEGHLSLLRSSLVSNKTQAIVYDDLGMSEYVIKKSESGTVKTKEKADFVEALIGALYVDQDLEMCKAFCNVCFFPRLRDFIAKQEWNDAKSQLQQCCLTLRRPNAGEPEVPSYKMLKSTGPSNNRLYEVAVYFQGERLAKGEGASIQQAEMNAASAALEAHAHRFPQFNQTKHQQDEDCLANGEPSPDEDRPSGVKKRKRSPDEDKSTGVKKRKQSLNDGRSSGITKRKHSPDDDKSTKVAQCTDFASDD